MGSWFSFTSVCFQLRKQGTGLPRFCITEAYAVGVGILVVKAVSNHIGQFERRTGDAFVFSVHVIEYEEKIGRDEVQKR
jgi:hypothetical protein